MTKKLLQWAMAAALICGASVFTACTTDNDDNPVAEPDLGVAEKIIGKWMLAEIDGEPALTNDKDVFTFLSATKANNSTSRVDYVETVPKWYAKEECDMTIDGNTVTLLSHSSMDKVFTLNIKSIDDNNMSCNFKIVVMKDGKVRNTEEDTRIYRRVTADYSDAILGTWEGHVTSEQDTYGDGLLHRWEYKADGTYVYYVKDGDNWVPSANTLNEYFVAGNLLCSRWINAGTELREWWEIESIEDGVMKWKALRQDTDGNTFTSTFQMEKVN